MYPSTKIIKVYRLLELKIDWLIVYNVYVQLENISFKWMETMPLSVKICNLGHKFGSNGGGVGVFTVEHLLLHGLRFLGYHPKNRPFYSLCSTVKETEYLF